MVPLTSLATCKGVPVTQILSKEQLDEVAAATKVGGATLTGLLDTSAWYAPGAAAAFMAESVIKDEKRVVSCGVLVEGEYGESDLVIGVPVVLGRNGCEKIIDFPINDEEKAAFKASANATRKVNQILVDGGLI
jgi:malate dehydrogenase